MELEPLKLERERNSILFFPYTRFLQHILKYGNKEWLDYEELKKEVEKTTETKLFGFISPHTAEKWGKGDFGKLYVVSYCKRILFFMPGGVILCK